MIRYVYPYVLTKMDIPGIIPQVSTPSQLWLRWIITLPCQFGMKNWYPAGIRSLVHLVASHQKSWQTPKIHPFLFSTCARWESVSQSHTAKLLSLPTSKGRFQLSTNKFRRLASRGLRFESGAWRYWWMSPVQVAQAPQAPEAPHPRLPTKILAKSIITLLGNNCCNSCCCSCCPGPRATKNCGDRSCTAYIKLQSSQTCIEKIRKVASCCLTIVHT